MQRAFDLLSFVIRSENRVAALQALDTGTATRAELQDRTGIPRATLSRILADFQDRGLADRQGYEFSITTLGQLLVREVQTLFRSIEVAFELEPLARWLPLSELEIEVGDLADARVTLPTPLDPLAPVHRTAAVLAGSERVRGLCNNVIPDLLETLATAVIEDGLLIEVVVASDAFTVVSNEPSVSTVVRDLIDSGRVDLSVSTDEIPQLAIDADGTVLLEVTDHDGVIRGLVETRHDAVRSWFESAYDTYRREADPIAAEVLTS